MNGPNVVVAIPAEHAQAVANALGILLRRRWLDGDTVPPELQQLRRELDRHGQRWAEQTSRNADAAGGPHGVGAG